MTFLLDVVRSLEEDQLTNKHMNEKEINIAIAEHLGAKWVEIPPPENKMWNNGRPSAILTFYDIADISNWERAGGMIPIAMDGERIAHHDIPKYSKDLNAMHKVEEALGLGEKWWRYRSNLINVQSRSEEFSDGVRTTALQRAEAFLTTLNLWKS